MFSLKGQVAVVTGGASGIGRGISEVLSGAGAQVVIADIDAVRGEATAGELGAEFIQVDVTQRASVENLVSATLERFGRLDVMCSNTGIFPQVSLDSMTDEQWDRTMQVNLKGTFLVVQAALKPMRKQKYGRIVITSSVTGSITGFPGWAHYGASKAGQQGFMRSAALECARDGVTINAVLPGNILTDGLKAQGEDYIRSVEAGVPMKTLGTPQDIGAAACFLASPKAHYITGQTIIIDGGQLLPESVEAVG